MPTNTIEWAAFTLKNSVSETQLLSASDAMQREFLDQQHGFLKRDLLSFGDGQYADCVVWESREMADLAMQDAVKFSSCMHYFDLLQIAASPLHGTSLRQHQCSTSLDDFGGMEFSLFRLRTGAQMNQLAPAAHVLTQGLYRDEPGYLGHHIVHDGNGQFADVLFADTAVRARQMCDKWGAGPYAEACKPYLDLIDHASVSMQFWHRLT